MGNSFLDIMKKSPNADIFVSASFLKDKAGRAVMAALGEGCARYVGGAVRDALLGRPVKDYDIATVLEPKQVVSCLKAAGLKAVLTGWEHGTVTAISQHRPFEITSLRQDLSTDGRHAEVAFTTDWRVDASRRDFTMNALYADMDGRVYDYVDGLADLKAGRVRFIGNPQDRITEDALRILRFFRFHAYYGQGDLDPAGLAAAISEQHRLDILSIERVREEMLRLLAADNPVPVLTAMAGGGILAHVLSEWTGDMTFARLHRLMSRERALNEEGNSLRRLASLVKPAELARLGARWRLSRADQARLAAMASPAPHLDEKSLRCASYHDGAASVRDRILLGDSEDNLATALTFLDKWTRPVFPVQGRHLIKLGMTAGLQMGAVLERLESQWIESDFKLDREALLDEARQILTEGADSDSSGQETRDA